MTLDEIRQFLEGPATISLRGDEFAGLTGNGAIKRAVYDSYARVKWEVCNAVIVNSVKGGGRRFYLHEVGKIEDMKKSGGLRFGSSDCSALSSTPGSIRFSASRGVHEEKTDVAGTFAIIRENPNGKETS